MSPSAPPAPSLCIAHPFARQGGFFLPLFGNELELGWHPWVRALLYALGLLYAFFGVSIVSDIFMESIDVITSQTHWVDVVDPVTKAKSRQKVLIWNATVANLSLMALGTSAPEILLNVVEVVGKGFHAGELGPSTIVGSAAFNFLVIIAVCIVAVPDGEERRIRSFATFVVTTVTSLLAYGWMYVAVSVSSPNVITIGEAAVTFLCLPLLVLAGYHADIGTFGYNDEAEVDEDMEERTGIALRERTMMLVRATRRAPRARRSSVDWLRATDVRRADTHVRPRSASRVAAPRRTPQESFDPESMRLAMASHMEWLKSREEKSGRNGRLTVQQLAQLAAADLGLSHIKSRAYYRVHLSRSTYGAKRNELVSDAEVADQRAGASGGAAADGGEGGAGGAGGGAGAEILFIVPQKLRRGTTRARDKEATLQKTASRVAEKVGHTVHQTSKRVSLICCGGDAARAPPAVAASEPPREEETRRPTHDLRNLLRVATDRRLLAHVEHRSDDARAGRGADGAPVVRLQLALDGDSHAEDEPVWRLWRQHVVDAVLPHGAADVDTGLAMPPTRVDVALHVVSLPWKLLTALVCPPASWRGGVPCFGMTLALVGLLTALISDLASILGCIVGIPDPVTAITLVAVGTSVPDTFASRIAAINEPTADASITNVTGSNSVNVFIGLGLPWLFASFYWRLTGPTADWAARYPDVAAQQPPGRAVYVLVGGDLGFSVILFWACCLLGVLIILMRRFTLGAELGGPRCAKYASAALLFSLWLSYIAVVTLRLFGAI